MAVVKIVNDAYKNDDAIQNLIAYVLNKNKMPHRSFGGVGIDFRNPAESMMTIKNVFEKSFGKQAEHVILAFDKMETRFLAIPFIEQIAQDVCMFFNGLQVLFAVHEVKNSYISDDYGDGCVHIHFIINTVNIQSGKKYNINYGEAFKLQSYIKTVMLKNGLSGKVQLVMT